MAVLSPAEQTAAQEGRLAAGVELPSGAVKRWGPDEASTADVLAGLTFTTSDPGGFKDSNFGLARDIDLEWADLSLLLPLHLYGAGGRTAWEGRLQERPGRHGAENEISPGAVGWQAHLADRVFQEIYIDRDQSKWEEPGVARKLELININHMTAPAPVQSPGDGESGQALIQNWQGLTKPQAGAPYPGGEAIYYGNGVDIGSIWYDQLNEASTPFERYAMLGTTEAANSDLSTNYSGIPESLNQTLYAAGAGRKYAHLMGWYVGGVIGAFGGTYQVWRNVFVAGRVNVPIKGTWPKMGFYASDVLADIVGRFAPKLRFSTGIEGSIQPTNFIIPQLAFTDPIKPSDAIGAINAYHQYSWGVEDERTFFFRPTSTFRKRWRIRRSRGDGVELLGAQADAAVNGVIVTFTDPGGRTRVVGPPEYSTAYATAAALADTSPTNPVNIVGGGQKWGELSLGFVTDVSGAIQIGAMWLASQLSNANSRGSVTVTGVVEDEHGSFFPSWAMRAGDSATVVDGDNVERRIIETTYSADSRQVNCNLDATPHHLEAIMEQMGIAVAGL